MTVRIVLRLPKDTSTPPVGTAVSVPVEGGTEWLELGIIEEAHWHSHDGHVTLTLRLHPQVTLVGTADEGPPQVDA